MAKINLKYFPITNAFAREVNLGFKDIKSGIKKTSKMLKKVNLCQKASETEKAIESIEKTLTDILKLTHNLYELTDMSFRIHIALSETFVNILKSNKSVLLVLAELGQRKKKR